MYCDRCGTKLQESQNFCPSCGKGFNAPPLMPTKGRIAGHIRLLGILWLALSAFRLVPAFVLLTIANHGVHFFPPDVPEFVPAILQGVGYLLLIGAGFGLAAGWGLLDRQPWARMLAIVLGCLNLLDMPFGTALGIYSLWVLLPAQSEQEYKRMAKVA
ncbi:MAG TPA: zinc ribbon domain-containing protein [Bryobacteraceae bacterium]|nr:zinc ribbon domain-containing protein [Bryobacteraceae bacterium]